MTTKSKGDDDMATQKTLPKGNGSTAVVDPPQQTSTIPPVQQPTDLQRQAPAVPARLPFVKIVGDTFGVSSVAWKALVEAVFPLATSIDSVVLALSYCKARNLDPFKRVVHIVPIWNKELGRMVDTIWPGIGELRTTAFRTGCYAGRGPTVTGPDTTLKVGNATITFPEWMQVTVRRAVKGAIVEFVGPRVYWLETYTMIGGKAKDQTPNSMWSKRPRGQLEKCAEASALRAAFPEELGDMHGFEESGIFSDPPRTLIEAKAETSTGGTTSQRLADELTARRAVESAEAESAEAGSDTESESAGEQKPGSKSDETIARIREYLSHSQTAQEIKYTEDEIRMAREQGDITEGESVMLTGEAEARRKELAK